LFFCSIMLLDVVAEGGCVETLELEPTSRVGAAPFAPIGASIELLLVLG
jgi:hypothetical protein